jgi:hypothetical protein
MPYHLLGLISMTPALWVFLFAPLAILLSAVTLCFLRATTPIAASRLVLGNTITLILSLIVSALTVLAGFLESLQPTAPTTRRPLSWPRESSLS